MTLWLPVAGILALAEVSGETIANYRQPCPPADASFPPEADAANVCQSFRCDTCSTQPNNNLGLLWGSWHSSGPYATPAGVTVS